MVYKGKVIQVHDGLIVKMTSSIGYYFINRLNKTKAMSDRYILAFQKHKILVG